MALTDLPNERNLPNQPGPSHRTALQGILPYTTVLVILVAVWVAWILYSRHGESARAQAEIEAKQEQARKETNDLIFQHGELTFTTFEAADGTVRPGQKTELCYGVVNAKSMKIDPPIEQIKPSSRHCMEIAPQKTTTYTITADDGAGHSKSLSLTVHVK